MGPRCRGLVTVTPISQLIALGQLLDRLEIQWVLGGSLASSLIGEPRTTMDIDIAIRVSAHQLPALIEAVQDEYYTSLEMAASALVHHQSFNIIHLGGGLKVDLFPLNDSLLDRLQVDRRIRVNLTHDAAVWVSSPIDQILRKLWWFRSGGEVSDRQWRDVQAILRIQRNRFDVQQLCADAGESGLLDLTLRALNEADYPANPPDGA